MYWLKHTLRNNIRAIDSLEKNNRYLEMGWRIITLAESLSRNSLHKLRYVLLSIFVSLFTTIHYLPPQYPQLLPTCDARVCTHVTIQRHTLNIEKVDFPCLDMINAPLSRDKKWAKEKTRDGRKMANEGDGQGSRVERANKGKQKRRSRQKITRETRSMEK